MLNKRYHTFGYKDLNGKLAAKLAKWVEMFPLKDDKGMTVPDDDDEGSNDSVEQEASGSAQTSGSATVFTMPSDDDDE